MAAAICPSFLRGFCTSIMGQRLGPLVSASWPCRPWPKYSFRALPNTGKAAPHLASARGNHL